MKKIVNKKVAGRIKRHNRIRSKVTGDAKTPRLCVFRSNRYVYAQIIDDTKGNTLVATDSKTLKQKAGMAGAVAVGKEIASLAKSKGVESVVFDRGGFLYTGQIKALAESAREAGLKF